MIRFVLQKSQECVQANTLEWECVMRRVSMTVTVQTMRSAAAVDVDVSAWRYLQVCYTNALVIFFSITVIESFSDLVSLCLYNRKAWSVSEGI